MEGRVCDEMAHTHDFMKSIHMDMKIGPLTPEPDTSQSTVSQGVSAQVKELLPRMHKSHGLIPAP